MSGRCLRHRRSLGPAWLAVAVGTLCVAMWAGAEGQARFPSAAGRKSDYRAFRAVSPFFSMEYPRKNWQVLPGYGASLVLFASTKADATVGVEHVRLNLPLRIDDIGEQFIRYETDDLKAARPAAWQLETSIVQANSGPVVVIDFRQDGALGPQQVRQYSLPRHEHLYRVVCTASPSAFIRFVPTFEYMAASLLAEATAPQ